MPSLETGKAVETKKIVPKKNTIFIRTGLYTIEELVEIIRFAEYNDQIEKIESKQL